MAERGPFARLVERLARPDGIAPGATLARSWPLEGGVSATVDALELQRPDGTVQRVVVRRHGATTWKPHDAEVTAKEYALLGALFAARGAVAVPEPLFLDARGELLPSPFFVMTFVEGTTTVAPDALPDALQQMAEALARLHALDPDLLALPDLPRDEDPITGALSYLPDPSPLPNADLLRTALADLAARTATPPPARSLLHGDFWPGNILWRDGTIAAVLDWEDASLGDPNSDLAGCRIELLWKHGEAAMTTFTDRYLAKTARDTATLPLWELYAALASMATMHNWGLDPAREARMRERATWFGDRAAQRILAAARGR